MNVVTIQHAIGMASGASTWTLRAEGLTALTHCRACLMWRHVGETAWRTDWAGLPTVTEQGCDALLSVGPLMLRFVLQKRPAGGWILGGELCNGGTHAVELARLHYLDGTLEQPEGAVMITQAALSTPPLNGEFCFAQGRQSPPLKTKLDRNALSDPIYDAPNWVCAVDSAAFTPKTGAHGWFCGAIGPGVAYGQIGWNTSGPEAGRFFAGQVLDNILLPAGGTRILEKLELFTGDWQTALREWASDCAHALGVPKPRPPLVGWCSWYRNFSEITREDFETAVREFAALPNPPGGRMIQIDDGFQRTCGDWRPNERWAEGWSELPKRIDASGSIPSLWLAPTCVQDTVPVFKEHPDWFQRMADGRLAFSMINWGHFDDPTWKFGAPGGHLAYVLETDHPEVRAHIAQMLKAAVAEGWRAFKFDFATVITGRVAYDRSKTSFETFRDCYRLYRDAVGPDALINACIGGPHARFAMGSADSARLATDMLGNWTFIKGVLPLLMLRMAACNGIWWTGDPDVFYMRRRNNEAFTGTYFEGPEYVMKATEEEQYLLTATNGLMGAMFYTSDLPSEWTAEGRPRLLEFWGADRPVAPETVRIAWDLQAGLPRALRVDSMKDGRSRTVCALYNWGDAEATVKVSLADLGLDAGRAWRLNHDTQGIMMCDDTLISTQPPHSLRHAYLST